MSYIRELRPYMYWLGYLQDARDAGELDWQAIGGTWGIATSNVGKWQPDGHAEIPFEGFGEILDGDRGAQPVLSKYVHKYFCDMAEHIGQLFAVTKADGDDPLHRRQLDVLRRAAAGRADLRGAVRGCRVHRRRYPGHPQAHVQERALRVRGFGAQAGYSPSMPFSLLDDWGHRAGKPVTP